MSRRNGWISIFIAVPGLAVCAFTLVGFFRKIVTNSLPFHPSLNARDYYLAVGRAYSNGFLTGFFLCFFLTLAILALPALATRRPRSRQRQGREEWAKEPLSFPKRSA